MKKIILLFTIIIFSNFSMSADIQLPAIIGNHMVLKQKGSVPLWGKEDAGTPISIYTSWNKKTYSTISDLKGDWKINIKTPVAGGPYEVIIKGKNTVTLTDVLIGEVWLSSGQSNMEFTLKRDKQAKTALEDANNHPTIRLFKVQRQVCEQIQENFAPNTSWKICSKETAAGFSAMTYYFAVQLQEKLHVPIGLINASWGGTGIEAWISDTVQQSDTLLQKPIERWNNWLISYKTDSLNYENEKLRWKTDSINGIKRKRPQEPQGLIAINRPHRKPGVLYNGMIAPCIPYALTGILWYQGTSNVNFADEYEHQLNTLIQSWRKAWGEDFDALIGQLTAYDYASSDNASILREAQLNQRKLKNTYVFCSIDSGDLKDVHPVNKFPYGERFSFLALSKVYHFKDVPFTSPIFKSMKQQSGTLVISFENNKGLYIKGEKLNDIFISTDGTNFLPALAKVENNKLIVYHPDIQSPVAVKYAWNNTVDANLYNGDNLPAFPFRK